MTTGNRIIRVSELLGNTGVRRLAGRILNGHDTPVTRHTLLRWRTRGFPEPLASVDGFEIWSRADVEAWLRERAS